MTNSVGKVLAWTLTFQKDESVIEFLDHVKKRYEEFPDGKKAVVAERYLQFPNRSSKLSTTLVR